MNVLLRQKGYHTRAEQNTPNYDIEKEKKQEINIRLTFRTCVSQSKDI